MGMLAALGAGGGAAAGAGGEAAAAGATSTSAEGAPLLVAGQSATTPLLTSAAGPEMGIGSAPQATSTGAGKSSQAAKDAVASGNQSNMGLSQMINSGTIKAGPPQHQEDQTMNPTQFLQFIKSLSSQ